jgi:pantothenate kinase type III
LTGRQGLQFNGGVIASSVTMSSQHHLKGAITVPDSDVAEFEKLIDTLSTALRNLLPSDSIVALKGIVTRPGWTTPAESAFFRSSLLAMTELTNTLGRLQTATVEAAGLVGP